MPKIYDNIENNLSTALNNTLEVSTRADFCVGYFNLRGWKEVVDRIDTLCGSTVQENSQEVFRVCRLLVGMQKQPVEILREYFATGKNHIVDNAEALKLKKRLAQDFKDQLTIGTPTDADEAALRRLSSQMKNGKVAVKLHLRYPLHAKLYLAHSDDMRVPKVGFLGSSNLTLAGLAKQGELNIDVMDQDAADKLAKWFDERWLDTKSIDITQMLIEIIDDSWAADKLIPPYHIYIKMAYHLSREARAGISENKIPTIFKGKLLDFQEKAVLTAAHHLHKRGGVVIGDVVGLGKTITATALAKIMEEVFCSGTLIICPKNLIRMWDDYVHKYQLHAKVISQSMVQRLLPDMPRYRLVIIDESHNLRNDQASRYRAIKSYLDGNDCKVILLSATPYNKSYIDLSNQLRLFIADDKDLGISPERYIESVGGAVSFISKHDAFIRSIKAFEKSYFADDWRELMRLYLVRRTRSFIKDNYAHTDSDTGQKYLTFSDGSKSYFPERLPKKVEYEFNPKDTKDQYARMYSKKIVDTINSLNVPRYGLGNYIASDSSYTPTNKEQTLINNLSRAGKRLMGFCRTNLFKRLESSGYSFLLSLSRHTLRNFVFIYAIENRLPLPIGKNIIENLDDYIDDSDVDGNGDDNFISFITDQDKYLRKGKEVYELFATNYKKKFEWINSQLFSDNLKAELIQDVKSIIGIIDIAKDWNPELDRQLNALDKLITQTHADEKVSLSPKTGEVFKVEMFSGIIE